MAADRTTNTWIDERGHETGVTVCGAEASTHPDDPAGGLEKCGDCGRNTCAQCRTWRGGACICSKCSAPASGRRTGKRKKSSRTKKRSYSVAPRRRSARHVLGRRRGKRKLYTRAASAGRLTRKQKQRIADLIHMAATENAGLTTGGDMHPDYYRVLKASAREYADYTKGEREHADYGAPRPLTDAEADEIYRLATK